MVKMTFAWVSQALLTRRATLMANADMSESHEGRIERLVLP